jgi:hypothetical protein
MSRRSTAYAKLFAEEVKPRTVQERVMVKKEEPAPTMEYGMVPRDFAEAVRACREGRMGYADKLLLQTRYGTEGFFFTAVEDIYVINEWEFSRNDKAAFRALFRSRAPIRA